VSEQVRATRIDIAAFRTRSFIGQPRVRSDQQRRIEEVGLASEQPKRNPSAH
jgi:hypothetical protein